MSAQDKGLDHFVVVPEPRVRMKSWFAVARLYGPTNQQPGKDFRRGPQTVGTFKTKTSCSGTHWASTTFRQRRTGQYITWGGTQ